MYYQQITPSPLGDMLLLSDETSLVGIWFVAQKHYAANYDLATIENFETPVLAQTKKWLNDYFLGHNPSINDLKLNPEVTPFRKAVLDILLTIPYGKTMSYQEIADTLVKNGTRKTSAARAVGGAVGHNPISLIIPCHRVIAKNGNLTGFAGGINRKIALLTLEGAAFKK